MSRNRRSRHRQGHNRNGGSQTNTSSSYRMPKFVDTVAMIRADQIAEGRKMAQAERRENALPKL